jgi:hypothetical protein
MKSQYPMQSPQLCEVGYDSSNNHICSHPDESSVSKMWVASVIETRVSPGTRDARTGNVCKRLLNAGRLCRRDSAALYA